MSGPEENSQSWPGKGLASVDAFLWEPTVPEPPSPQPTATSVAHAGVHTIEATDWVEAPQYGSPLPAGMFNNWPFSVFLEIDKPFTGLVVLIDICAKDGRPPRSETLLQSISGQIAGLIGEGDFGCRTSDDAFVLVFPGERDADAKRRLNVISDRLWNAQQRAGGSFSLHFSWGGLGKQERPFREAFAAAVQRMNQIGRRRRSISMGSVNRHRTIV